MSRRAFPNRTESASERGFTLVEVMVAFVMLSLVVLGIAAFSLGASKSLNSSKRLSLATVVAHQALDSVRSKDFATVAAGSTTGYVTTGRYSFSVVTTVANDTLPVPLLKTVTVSVFDGSKEIQRLRSALYNAGS